MVINISLIRHERTVLQRPLHSLNTLLVLLECKVCQSEFIQDLSILIINVKSSVKVFNRVLEHTHVIVALSSILEELNVLWFQADCLVKMINGFLKLAHHVITLS